MPSQPLVGEDARLAWPIRRRFVDGSCVAPPYALPPVEEGASASVVPNIFVQSLRRKLTSIHITAGTVYLMTGAWTKASRMNARASCVLRETS